MRLLHEFCNIKKPYLVVAIPLHPRATSLGLYIRKENGMPTTYYPLQMYVVIQSLHA